MIMIITIVKEVISVGIIMIMIVPTTHVFQPVAIETLGPLDPSACDFIN